MALIDGFNRKIDYLRLSVTDRCNFRCVYCMPSDGMEFVPRDELLTFDEIERIVRVLVNLGIEKIRLTGGEPTVRKDIAELVRRIGRLPLRSFAMTTNGYLLYDMVEEFWKAGLQRINISLDTLQREKFKQMARFDGFDQVWQAIWKSLAEGLDPVKINMVAMRGINDDEILEFVELARQDPFHIRFIEYMPSSGDYGNTFDSAFIIKTEELKQIVLSKYELQPVMDTVKTGPAKVFQIPGFRGKIGFIDPYSDHFCSSCNRIRLTSLGKLKWCLFSNDGLDVKQFIREGKTDAELSDWIREKIVSDKPERHPPGISELIQVNTVFSQVGG
ncbi:GTP 3',8-cyclase MoaA [bacterium]|nr:GTP 3',8-cyclase MoaA [bacterium]